MSWLLLWGRFRRCVLTTRLLEDSNRSVLLLEAGHSRESGRPSFHYSPVGLSWMDQG
jgi:hypothetical protein